MCVCLCVHCLYHFKSNLDSLLVLAPQCNGSYLSGSLSYRPKATTVSKSCTA
jgi:hypothetical protein